MNKQFIIDNILSTHNRIKSLKLKEYNITREQVYLIYHNTTKPKCPECNKDLKFIRFNILNIGCYPEFCSRICLNKSKLIVERRQNTCLKRYDNPKFNNPDKNLQTRLNNNGGKYFSDEQRMKYINTSLLRFNTEYPFQAEIVKEKSRQTKIERYGNPVFTNAVQRESTNLTKYGGISSFCDPTVQLKAKKTKIKRGVQIADEYISDFILYKRVVWKYTNRQDLALLPNFEKRGRSDLKDDAYSLDHKFSIKQGFINNIPAHLIGSFKNLEMLPYDENRKKKDKCSIYLTELK